MTEASRKRSSASEDELRTALEIEVQPSENRRSDFLAAIDRDVVIIKRVHNTYAGRRPGELRDYLTKYVKALKNVQRLTVGLGERDQTLIFRGLGDFAAAVDPKRFLAEIGSLNKTANHYADTLTVKDGSKPWDGAKYVAALRAFDLVKEFCEKKRASRARDGVVARAAGVLYELATKTRAGDMSQYLPHADPAQDRIEPALISRLTFRNTRA